MYCGLSFIIHGKKSVVFMGCNPDMLRLWVKEELESISMSMMDSLCELTLFVSISDNH